MFSTIVSFVALLAVTSACAATLTRNAVVPPEYFGLHIHGIVAPRPDTGRPTPWPAVPFGAWRLWDAYTRWADLEPAQNRWNWTKLDAYVDAAQAHGVEVTLVLGSTPRWASARPDEPCSYGHGCAAEPVDLVDWDDYVRTVVTRYRGRIRYYELWNEPQFTETEKVAPGKAAFWSGSAAAMMELGWHASAILRVADPQARLLAPGVVNGSQRLQAFFEAGGGRFTDIASYHFYTERPEDVPGLASMVRGWLTRGGISDVPLWNTEMGYEIGSRQGGRRLGEQDVAAYLARALILGAASGFERTFWYSWDGGPRGLSLGGRPNAAGRAYARIYRWLAGAVLETCESSPDGRAWHCALRRGPRRGWVVWHTQRTASWRPPVGWGVRAYEPLDGEARVLSVDGKVPRGPAPVLLLADEVAWRP